MVSRLVWACVDLDAIRHNVAALKHCTKPGVTFMAVVKANAYGHGALEVARAAVEGGADCLGVARLDEAIHLRNNGITSPLLVFGYVLPGRVSALNDLNLVATVYDVEMAKRLSEAAMAKSLQVPVHLKVDTGMGRVGTILKPADGVAAVSQILDLKGVTLQGVYTHFAAADSRDKTYTNGQISLFNAFLSDLEKSGWCPDVCHAANSAGIIDHPTSHYDMVRAGISLYGLYPSDETDRSRIDLKPAMTLKAIITSVREVPKGFKISYGMTYETPSATKIASVPIGYADGYSRLLSSKGSMLIRGQQAPILGRVCMDQTIVDVGHIQNVTVGDEVVVMGSQGNQTISADDIARQLGTINYEIVSSITARVPRVYDVESSD